MRQASNLGGLSLGLILLFSAGCISVQSSPSARFYSLQPMKAGAPVSESGAMAHVMVGVGPVTFPEYYNRPQIVIRRSDNTLEFAQFDRWAEPLDKSLARTVSQNLGVLLPQVNAQTFPWSSILPVRYQIIMDLLQLDNRLDKEVNVSAQWSILDARDKRVIKTRHSDYRMAVDASGYSGLVAATSAICESLSREIAQALVETARNAPVE